MRRIGAGNARRETVGLPGPEQSLVKIAVDDMLRVRSKSRIPADAVLIQYFDRLTARDGQRGRLKAPVMNFPADRFPQRRAGNRGDFRRIDRMENKMIPEDHDDGSIHEKIQNPPDVSVVNRRRGR